MKRIIVICEGETEKEFCNKTLSPYFFNKGYHIQAPLIKRTKGGIVKWEALKKQIETHLLAEKDAFVTMLIDYYGIYDKHQFPQWEESKLQADKSKRMQLLEDSIKRDVNESVQFRFIPYLQLHEFEGLLFNDIQIFYDCIPSNELLGVEELTKTFNEFSNPEMINDKKETSPSHRLKRIIAGYNKVVYGNILAETIGLQRLRNKSPRFHNWLMVLENL